MTYIRHHYELDNNIEFLRMQHREKIFQVIGDELCKTTVTGPLIHSISKAECKELLIKINAGICGGHISSRAIATKVFKQGFYWP
jgi:hypothetical protein